MNFVISFDKTNRKIVTLDATYSGTMVFTKDYDGVEIKTLGDQCCSSSRAKGLDLSATKITVIEYGAFFNSYYLTNIILPETIVSIAMNAFRYSCITSFTIKPNLVTFDGALSMCANITKFINEGNSRFYVSDEGVYLSDKKTLVRACGNVTFDSIKYMDMIEHFSMYAFSRTGLERFVATKKITEINEGTFEECFNLFELDLVLSPATTIGAYYFKFCRVLKILVLPAHVKTINTQVFYGCALSGVFLPCTIDTLGNNCFGYQVDHTIIFYFGMKKFTETLFEGCAITPTVYVDSKYPYANFSTILVQKSQIGDMFVSIKKVCTCSKRRISPTILFVTLSLLS